MSLDRIAAIILFCGSIFVALDIPYELSGDHGLWGFQLVREIVWPIGFIIVLFWLLAASNTLRGRWLYWGWTMSMVWHFGWLAWLAVTIFGFLVFMTAAPLLFTWMLMASVLSIAALQKVRLQKNEVEQVAASDR